MKISRGVAAGLAAVTSTAEMAQASAVTAQVRDYIVIRRTEDKRRSNQHVLLDGIHSLGIQPFPSSRLVHAGNMHIFQWQDPAIAYHRLVSCRISRDVELNDCVRVLLRTERKTIERL